MDNLPKQLSIESTATESTPQTSVQPSARRSEQARINGKLSRGPRSLRGKAASRRNAFKHGLSSRTVGLVHDASGSANLLESIKKGLVETYRPRDVEQRLLVDNLASELYLLRRCDEAFLAKLQPNPIEGDVPKSTNFFVTLWRQFRRISSAIESGTPVDISDATLAPILVRILNSAKSLVSEQESFARFRIWCDKCSLEHLLDTLEEQSRTFYLSLNETERRAIWQDTVIEAAKRTDILDGDPLILARSTTMTACLDATIRLLQADTAPCQESIERAHGDNEPYVPLSHDDILQILREDEQQVSEDDWMRDDPDITIWERSDILELKPFLMINVKTLGLRDPEHLKSVVSGNILLDATSRSGWNLLLEYVRQDILRDEKYWEQERPKIDAKLRADLAQFPERLEPLKVLDRYRTRAQRSVERLKKLLDGVKRKRR